MDFVKQCHKLFIFEFLGFQFCIAHCGYTLDRSDYYLVVLCAENQ